MEAKWLVSLLLFFAAAFLALSLASYRVDPFDPTQQGSDLAGATVMPVVNLGCC